MRRLLAIFKASRKSVSNNNKVGKTLNSTARLICTAERKTMIDAAIESESRKSSAQEGSGTSMTKITLIAASGSTYSRSRSRKAGACMVLAGRAAVLIAGLL